jgi:hypothetical protein
MRLNRHLAPIARFRAPLELATFGQSLRRRHWKPPDTAILHQEEGC